MRKIPFIDKMAYGVGDLSNATAMQIVSSYLVFFLTAVLGMPGTIAGLAVAFSVFWDAFTDPIMGYISDYTKSKRFGRRHLYILIGMFLVILSILGLFHIPVSASLTVKTGLLFGFIIIYKTALTMLITPYAALGSELTTDYLDRTKLQSIRASFFVLGIMLTVAVGMLLFFQPTTVFPVGQLNPNAYRSLAWFVSGLVFLFTSITLISTAKYIPYLKQFMLDQKPPTWTWEMFVSILFPLTNKLFLAIAISYAFINMASAFVNSVGIHVFTYTFDFSSMNIAIILGLQMGFTVLSQPLWVWIVSKTSKPVAIKAGLIIALIGALYFLGLVIMKNTVAKQLIFFIPYAVVVGIGTGALFTIPYSMVSDVIDIDQYNQGERKEGAYFGSITFLYKFSQAGAILLIGILLDTIGFSSNNVIQPTQIRLYLGLLLSVGVIVSFVLAYFSISQFKLRKEQLIEIQQKLLNE